MTTHLYCVLPDDIGKEIPAGLSGLAGARVRALPVDGLIAWVSDVARDVRVSFDGVRAHDAVVEAALETGRPPCPRASASASMMMKLAEQRSPSVPIPSNRSSRMSRGSSR